MMEGGKGSEGKEKKETPVRICSQESGISLPIFVEVRHNSRILDMAKLSEVNLGRWVIFSSSNSLLIIEHNRKHDTKSVPAPANAITTI